MIRPKHFEFNVQTAKSNSFQNVVSDIHLTSKVIEEFNAVVDLLLKNGIEVLVFDDKDDVVTPDAIFPNNWISVNNNSIVIYPMLAENRRLERRQDIIEAIENRTNRTFTKIDLTAYEKQGKFLEGTGSIVFDHINKLAYTCLSPRTNADVLKQLCNILDYDAILFKANDSGGNPIYHTNVMMAIGSGYAVVCADCITDVDERKMVVVQLSALNRELILINLNQMNAFAGNMLELVNRQNEKFIVLSETAYLSLSAPQIKRLKKHTQPLICRIPTIERTGGGSIRCMIAELFI